MGEFIAPRLWRIVRQDVLGPPYPRTQSSVQISLQV
jgi:hypothetical protein